MFRAMFSPIIRSTWLYLQYLVTFTIVVAGWIMDEFQPTPNWNENITKRNIDDYEYNQRDATI
jgi:hypothetical protein